ncbi:RICIN domain-containing protein [Streptomyces sp. NPDC088560]|uniref:RICIN domain-containing protein n=1 Tax=Streptomyces sp. NPDC088560 TaxID=3365868 RepID=UPI0038055526
MQQAPGGAANSLWLPLQQSDGSYAFRNQGSGLCLHVHGGGHDPGRQLGQWPCKDAAGTNQNVTPRWLQQGAACSTPPRYFPHS